MRGKRRSRRIISREAICPSFAPFDCCFWRRLIALAPAAHAAGDDTTRQTLDTARAALTDVESQLKADNLTDADLVRLRAESDPLVAELQAVITDLAPRLEASGKRLAELTPKSKDATLSDSASAELAAEKKKHDDLDADVRSARAMLLQIDDDNARIGAARRDLFARETFARSSSLISPLLWTGVAREAPSDVGAVGGAARRLAARPGGADHARRRRSACSRWRWRSRRCGRRCNGSRGG